MAAVLAIPGEAIQLIRIAAPFDDDPDAAGRTLRRVGHFRRQQKYLALADGYIGQRPSCTVLSSMSPSTWKKSSSLGS